MPDEDVTIEVCGDLVVTVAGTRRTEEVPGRQGRLALAYLALNRAQPASRERLVTAIWGEDASAGHGQALNVVLSKLRRALGPGVLETTPARCLLLAPRVRVDLDEAHEAFAQAHAAREREDWAAALAAASAAVERADRGLVEGLEAPWLEEPRRRLGDLRLEAREVIAEAGLALGRGHLGAAARAASELVAAAPFRERGYVLLMRVRAAEGNVAEALRVFDRLRTVLREELGVAPGPQAQAELQSLLVAGDAPAAPEPEPPPVAVAEPAPAPARRFFATRSDAGFVGRREELGRLHSQFARTETGRGRVVLVEGEPGIGKTRLALKAIADCEARGGLGLYGRCDADSVLPYQPFVEALRHARDRLPAARWQAWAERHGAGLARVLPELAGPAAGSQAGGGEELERYRLFEAVSDALVAITEWQPVVLVLDDVHWADRPTLLLMRQLARAAEHAPLLVLLAYRDAERSPELVDTLIHLRREHFLEQLPLRGLDERDATALMTELGSNPLPERVTRALWEETRGNPFFLEEILRHLESREARTWPLEHDLPEGVREVIGRRLDGLAESTARVLAHAAVIGREFDLDLLEAVGGVGEDALDDAVEEGVRAQLVAEMPEAYGRCSFTHALIRQVLYERLSLSRRSRLHLRVAEALEALGSGEDPAQLAELARHFALAPPARGAERAADYAQRAARHAAEMLAYEEAARLYRLALEALEAGRAGTPELRCRLLLGRGDAQTKAGDVEGARATFLEARRAALELGSPQRLAQVALGYGATAQMAGGVVDATLVSLLEEALDAAGPADAPVRARLLARLGMELSFAGQRERRAEITAQAVTIARRVGDPSALGLALVARHWALWGPENVAERVATAEEVLALADQTGDSRLELQGYRWRLIDALELGDVDAADEAIEAFERVADARGRVSEQLYVPMFRATRLLLAGELDAVDPTGREAVLLADRIGGDTNILQARLLQMVVLRREIGDLEALEDTVRSCATRFPTIPGWRCVLAHLHVLVGRREEAAAALEELSPGGFEALPLDGLWLGAVALLGETAALLGAERHASVLYERLLPYAERNVILGWVAACIGSASRPLGLLAAALGRPEDATAHFEAAAAMHARMRAAPWLARTRADHARVLLDGGADAAQEAGRLLDAALAGARELGMPVLAEEVAALRATGTGSPLRSA
jgi:DNA-binding SARP family transcriptional activator/RecA/RadA recombinase